MDIKPPENANEKFGQRYAHELETPPLVAEPPQHHKKGESWRSVFGTLVLFSLAPIIAVCIAAFALQSYQVDGQSMETTLQNRDRLIVNKIPRTWSRLTGHPYLPKRGDIIVFNESGLFDANGLAEKQLIKRVVGLPGDHVVIGGGKLTIYNAQHPAGYDPDTTGKYSVNAPTNPLDPSYSNVVIQPGQVFVCGDNRPNSEDSRAFGPISSDQVVGQLVLRIIPVGHAERF